MQLIRNKLLETRKSPVKFHKADLSVFIEFWPNHKKYIYNNKPFLLEKKKRFSASSSYTPLKQAIKIYRSTIWGTTVSNSDL